MPLPFPITRENYFDAAQGLFWYLADYHPGQRSEEYEILSVLQYRPAMSERGPDTEEAKIVYEYLEQNPNGAREVYNAIEAAYDETHEEDPAVASILAAAGHKPMEAKMPLAKRLDEALEIIERNPAEQFVSLIESLNDGDLMVLEELIQEAMNIYELMNKVRGVLKKIKEVAPNASTNPAYKGVEEMAYERDPNKIAKLAAGAALTDRLALLKQALEKVNLGELAAELEAVMPKPGLLQRAAGAAAGAAKQFAKPQASTAVPGWLRTLGGLAKTLGRQ